MSVATGEYRKHAIDDALAKALRGSVGDDAEARRLAETVMKQLEKHRLIYYSSPDEITLLSAAGRLLVALAETPDATQRSLAVFLGVSEGAIRKSVDQLVAAGLVAKTKVKNRNLLVIVPARVAETSDIRRLGALLRVLGARKEEDLF